MPLWIAGPGDLDRLTGLVAGFRDFLASEGPATEDIRSSLERLLEDAATEFLLAGEPAAGFVQIRFRTSLWNRHGAPDAWLEDLFVEETARRSGLGRILVEGAIRRAGDRGAARIQLDANVNNGAATALYESLGFVPRHNPARWGDGSDLFYTRLLD